MALAPILEIPALEGVALALALGLLIGIQRGWVERGKAAGTRFAGVRTYALLGFTGGLAGALHERAAGLATVLLTATAALVVIGYWRASAHGRRISGTSGIAELLTMACGFVAGGGEFALASTAAGAMVLVLSLRKRLHGLVAALDEREVLAIARFALIALVILPLLPDTPMGPYEAWRPRQLWLVVVLVSGFSFAGYLAGKWLGPARGVLATAAAGSMVSSTAVTAALGGKLREGADDPALLNGAVALASAVMFVRVSLLAAVLASFAAPRFALLAAPGLLVSVAASWLILRKRSGAPADPEQAALKVRNPLSLGPALVLMGLTMALIVAARWVLARYGNAGLATVLALSGTVDVDSAIITMGNLPAGTLSGRIAALVLVPPVVLNTLFKAGTLLALGGWRKAAPGAAALVASAIATGAAALLML